MYQESAGQEHNVFVLMEWKVMELDFRVVLLSLVLTILNVARAIRVAPMATATRYVLDTHAFALKVSVAFIVMYL